MQANLGPIIKQLTDTESKKKLNNHHIIITSENCAEIPFTSVYIAVPRQQPTNHNNQRRCMTANVNVLVLDLGVLQSVILVDLECDGLSGQSLQQDVHTTRQTEHQVVVSMDWTSTPNSVHRR